MRGLTFSALAVLKKLAKYKIFRLESEKAALHSVKFYTTSCRETILFYKLTQFQVYKSFWPQISVV